MTGIRNSNTSSPSRLPRALGSWTRSAALLLALAGPASADVRNDAFAAYQSHNYALAAELWLPLAQQGDAYSQWAMGTLYRNGQGVGRDLRRAMDWFRKSADQGLAGAQWDLGYMYAEGIAQPRDEVLARRWLESAVAQGPAQMQWDYAMMLADGTLLTRRLDEAERWYTLAAAQGGSDLPSRLARVYAGGGPLPKDLAKAYVWFSIANTPMTRLERANIEAQMSAAEMERAEAMLRDWTKAHGTGIAP